MCGLWNGGFECWCEENYKTLFLFYFSSWSVIKENLVLLFCKVARLSKLAPIGLELMLQQGKWPSIVMEILFYHYIIASGNQHVVDKMATSMFFPSFVPFLCYFPSICYYPIFCNGFVVGTPNPKLLNLIIYYLIFEFSSTS